MDFLSRSIGNKLIIKKMMGYFTVDCISFQNDNILSILYNYFFSIKFLNYWVRLLFELI